MQIFVFLLLFINAALAQVNDEAIGSHRVRVQIGAEALYRQYPHEFSAITVNDIIDYTKFHDLPKLMTTEQLQPFGYTHEKSIKERLLEFEGRHKDEMSVADRARLQEVIDDMNKVENQIKDEYLKGRRYSAIQMEQLKRSETISDIVDTGKFRAKEFGAKLINGVEYLTQRLKRWQDVEMGTWLEGSFDNHIAQTALRASPVVPLKRWIPSKKTMTKGGVIALILGVAAQQATAQTLPENTNPAVEIIPVGGL
jgi:hypothetical protein